MPDTDFYKNDEATFRNWEPGQPDNWLRNEHCAKLHETGLWNNDRCGSKFNAICSDVTGEGFN